MAKNGYEEAIRLVLETDGKEGIDQLRAALARLGDSSEGSASQASALASELEKLANTSTNIRNYTRLKATLTDTGNSLDKAKVRLRELNAEMSASETPSRRLAQATERAAKQVDRLSKLQNRQQAELTRTTNALAKAGVDTENLGQAYSDLQGEFARLGRSADGASGSLRKVGGETGGLSLSARKSAAAITSIAGGLVAVSGAAVTAAAALAAVAAAGTGAFFAGAIKSATTLEDALMEVRAVSGATAEEMVALKAAAESGAGATRFTALEAAKGLGELARATGSARTAIESLPAALNLAQAAGLDVGEAAQFITTTLTQFGLGADQASRVADVLAQAANATTTDVKQLGEALSYTAPLAKQLGMDTEDTVAVLGALADQGFRGERAGTALRNVLSELLDPSSQFAKAVRDLGIDSTDFATVIEQLAKSGDRGREALQLLDAAARPAILSLVNTGGAGLRQLEGDLRDAGGAAAETAKVMAESTSASADALQKQFDRARRALVEPILEPLRKELLSLSLELEQFAQSPEFEEIKAALSELFIESAKAARALLQEIDFKALAEDVRAFVTDASEVMSEFRENVGLVASTVETMGNAFSVWYNSFQTQLFASAAVLSKFVQLILQAANVVSLIPRKLQELATGADPVGAQLAEAIGGMGAVFDEFGTRALKNLGETQDALLDLVGANQSAKDSAQGLGAVADASGKAAEAAGAHAAATRDATGALDAQGKAATATAEATTAAADKAAEDAARLKNAFADLGIQSQESLERAAESARRNFELIRKAVAAGTATAADARRAFAVYAQAARAAVADSNDSARQRVEAELSVMDAIVNGSRALDDMGERGAVAGASVAGGAQAAKVALDDLAASAASASGAVGSVGSSTAGASGEMKKGEKAAQGMAFSIGQVGDAFHETWMQMSRSMQAGSSPLLALAELLKRLNADRKALKAYSDELDSVAKSYDELAERREELQNKYSFAGKDEIEAVLQKEKAIDDARKARAEAYRQEQEQQRQRDEARLQVAEDLAGVAQDTALATKADKGKEDPRVTVDFVLPSTTQTNSMTKLFNDAAELLVKLATPKIIQAIQRSKVVSNRR